MMLQRRVIGFVREAPVPVGLAVIAGLAAVGCLVGQGLLIAYVIREVLDGARPADVASLLIGVGMLALLYVTLTGAKDLAGAWAAAVVKRRLRRRLAARMLELGPGAMAVRRSGAVQATIGDGVEALQAYVGSYIPHAVVALVAPASLVGFMLLLDPVVGVLVAVAALVVPTAQPLWRSVLGERGAGHWEAHRQLSARFLDALQGMTTLKMLDATEHYGREVERDASRLYHATVANLAISLGVYSLVGLALGAGTAMAVGVGSLRFASGELDAIALLMVLFLAAVCLRPLAELQDYWHEGFYGLAASSGVFALLDESPAVTDDGRRRLVLDGPPDIEFDRVTFTYPTGERPALREIELAIGAGETVALIGRSGAGKSTVVALLQRWFDPDHGTLRINGRALPEVRLDDVRRAVAVVSQEIYLFHGSVADNLRIADPQADQARLESAARAACAHEFIVALPLGYDTPIGERGARLSGGERQRLAIARALLADAPVLVLDEATSSVDGENEALIKEAIAEVSRGRTMLVIAHRLSTIASADRVVVLDEGQVIEAGPPAELLAERGAYADMVTAQEAPR